MQPNPVVPRFTPKKKLTMLKCGILPQVQLKHLPQSWRLQSNNRHHASKWRPNCFAHLKCVFHYLICWVQGCWSTMLTIILGAKANLRQPFRRFSANMVPLQILFRTALVLRSLSASALAGAFKAARPWQQLKQMAAKHSPPIRLVLEDELQETIRARAKHRGSIHAKAPAKGRQPSAPIHLHPQDISIPNGNFGEPIAQFMQNRLQSAQGVVAFTESEVQPFLRLPGCLQLRAQGWDFGCCRLHAGAILR